MSRATHLPPSPTDLAGAANCGRRAPTSRDRQRRDLAGSVNPEGAATQAFFQYGLDLSQRGPGASTTLYDQQTPPQQVGSDAAAHTVTASLTGLIPGGLYHVRLVATNSAGTTFGPDQTFTTAQAAAPPPPVLGQSEDVKPVSGKVFIKLANGQFIPLTGATQIPIGRRDRRAPRHAGDHDRASRGAAHDAAAKGKKPSPRRPRRSPATSVARSSRSPRRTTVSPRWRSSRARTRVPRATRAARRTRPATRSPPPPRARRSSSCTPAPTASSAPAAATAPPPSAARSGTCATGATARSRATSPTRSRSPTLSATRRSSCTAARATWPSHGNSRKQRQLRRVHREDAPNRQRLRQPQDHRPPRRPKISGQAPSLEASMCSAGRVRLRHGLLTWGIGDGSVASAAAGNRAAT